MTIKRLQLKIHLGKLPMRYLGMGILAFARVNAGAAGHNVIPADVHDPGELLLEPRVAGGTLAPQDAGLGERDGCCADGSDGASGGVVGLEEGQHDIARAGFALDYLEARHALTLAPIASRKDGPIRLLVAAKIGKTRLIDNLGV